MDVEIITNIITKENINHIKIIKNNLSNNFNDNLYFKTFI